MEGFFSLKSKMIEWSEDREEQQLMTVQERSKEGTIAKKAPAESKGFTMNFVNEALR